ncbi:MAG: FtsX-like permease family protein [Candidatus Firestonebacteria bacterium]
MAKNNYELMIAVRFLKKGRAQTLLIILGIAMGVAVQFFLASLISGLQISLIDKTVGAAPHISVLPADSTPEQLSPGVNKDSRKPLYSEKSEIIAWQQYAIDLKADPLISLVAPVASGPGFIERGGITVPVVLKGVTAEGLQLYKVKNSIKEGTSELAGDTALFGKKLADKLALSSGDKIFLRNNRGEQIFVRVGGVFDLGSAAGDELVFLSLDRARSFLGINGVSAIEMQVKNVFSAEKTARRHARGLDRVKFVSWQEKNRELLQALSSQSSSSNTIQFFVILSISLGIASVLGIAAVQKQRQLGILKAMGTTNKSAAKIFIFQGFILGLIGSFLGILGGLALGVMFMSLPNINFGFDFSAGMLLTPVFFAVLASTIASTIPARSAAGLSPIEVIRNG